MYDHVMLLLLIHFYFNRLARTQYFLSPPSIGNFPIPSYVVRVQMWEYEAGLCGSNTKIVLP